jgi:hypothetical protein
MAQSDEILPPVLCPPLEVVLAKAVNGIPPPAALPGQVLFEPKFDGYLHCTLSTKVPSRRDLPHKPYLCPCVRWASTVCAGQFLWHP